jgi:antitoxin PrlF
LKVPGKASTVLTMRMTSKGQVTIPLDLREKFGLGPGTEVEVVAGEDGAIVRPAGVRARGAELVARLRDRADGDLDAEAVLRLTRGDSE